MEGLTSNRYCAWLSRPKYIVAFFLLSGLGIRRGRFLLVILVKLLLNDSTPPFTTAAAASRLYRVTLHRRWYRILGGGAFGPSDLDSSEALSGEVQSVFVDDILFVLSNGCGWFILLRSYFLWILIEWSHIMMLWLVKQWEGSVESNEVLGRGHCETNRIESSRESNPCSLRYIEVSAPQLLKNMMIYCQ